MGEPAPNLPPAADRHGPEVPPRPADPPAAPADVTACLTPMPSTPADAADVLLLRWEECWRHGQDVPAEELCRDRPELLDELRRRIERLKALDPLFRTTAPKVGPPESPA